MFRFHMLNNKYIPRESLGSFSEVNGNLVESFETARKHSGRVFIWEYNCEVDSARASQIIAMRLHSSKHVAVIVIGIDHSGAP